MLFRRALREHADQAPNYGRVWAAIREQARGYRQRCDQDLLWSYTSFHVHREWQLRCQWHTLEFTQFMSMSPVR